MAGPMVPSPPRASGGEPAENMDGFRGAWSSPRERG